MHLVNSLLPLVLFLAIFGGLFWLLAASRKNGQQYMGETTELFKALNATNKEILTELRAIRGALENGKS